MFYKQEYVDLLIQHKIWDLKTLEDVSQQIFNSKYKYLIYFPEGVISIIDFIEEENDQYLMSYIDEIAKEPSIPSKISRALILRILINHKNFSFNKFNLRFINYNIKNSWKTADLIWGRILHDQSIDYNYYTKRIILSYIYFVANYHYLKDTSENYTDTRKFIIRSINQTKNISYFKNQFNMIIKSLKNIF